MSGGDVEKQVYSAESEQRNVAEAIEAARFALADIILSLGVQGSFNPQWLAGTAVQVMLSRASRSESQ